MMNCAYRQLVLALLGVALACADSIPLPTERQVQYQTNEIMALIHFNIATFVQDGDPACNANNWNVSGNPATFMPTHLNVSNWVESFKAVGAKEAVLTAKHGCGFNLWPTKVTVPDGSVYPYTVAGPGGFGRDVLQEFSSTLEAAGIGHGFYYSLTNNFKLNVEGHYVRNTTLLPGQIKVTQEQFEKFAYDQLVELWTKYGSLTEIWFDGGYTSDMKSELTALLDDKQGQTVVFNGFGVSKNPVKWVGTESGSPQRPIWSLGCQPGTGDPSSSDWCPAGCDTTLQEGDTWFYEPGRAIRSLEEMIVVYHNTVGSNGVLELDFAIDRTGQVHPEHAARYKELGDWIRSCYGTPLAATSGKDKVLNLTLDAGADRVMVRENIASGQLIRSYVVEYQSSPDGKWLLFSKGESVGNKRIDVLPAPVHIHVIRLTVDDAVATPDIMDFSVYKTCPSA